MEVDNIGSISGPQKRGKFLSIVYLVVVNMNIFQLDTLCLFNVLIKLLYKKIHKLGKIKEISITRPFFELQTPDFAWK